jgi:hypothetical protein
MFHLITKHPLDFIVHCSAVGGAETGYLFGCFYKICDMGFIVTWPEVTATQTEIPPLCPHGQYPV